MGYSKAYEADSGLLGVFEPDKGLPGIGSAEVPVKLWKAYSVKLIRRPVVAIEWSVFERPGPEEIRSKGCLAEFVRLAERRDDDRDVLRFVKRFGALSCFPNCVGKPTEHEQRCREAVAWYRFYARRIRAVLLAVREHMQGKALSIPTWEQIGIPYYAGATWAKGGISGPNPFHNIGTQRLEIARLVNDWLNEAGAQPRLRFTGKGPAGLILDVDRQTRHYPCGWKHAFGNLVVPMENVRPVPHQSITYCVLGLQLASAVTSPYGMRLCKRCGMSYFDQNHRALYCGDSCRTDKRQDTQKATYKRRCARQAAGGV